MTVRQKVTTAKDEPCVAPAQTVVAERRSEGRDQRCQAGTCGGDGHRPAPALEEPLWQDCSGDVQWMADVREAADYAEEDEELPLLVNLADEGQAAERKQAARHTEHSGPISAVHKAAYCRRDEDRHETSHGQRQEDGGEAPVEIVRHGDSQDAEREVVRALDERTGTGDAGDNPAVEKRQARLPWQSSFERSRHSHRLSVDIGDQDIWRVFGTRFC